MSPEIDKTDRAAKRRAAQIYTASLDTGVIRCKGGYSTDV